MKRRLRLVSLLLALLFLLTACSGSTSDLITGAEDVDSSFRLGVDPSTQSYEDAMAAFPDADFQLFSSYTDGIAALESGKIDGLFFDKVILDEVCRENQSLTTIEETYGGGEIAGAVAKGNTELLEKVNAVLAQFKEDGTLEDMKRRWIDGEDRTMPTLEPPENPVGSLRILTEGEVLPFSYIGEDDEILGLDVELGIRIAFALNMTYSIEAMNFSALIPTLASGKGDLLLAEVSVTEERKKEIDFTDSYYYTTSTMLVQKSRYAGSYQATFDMTDEERDSFLSSATIASLSGTVPEIYAEEHYPTAKILSFESRTDELAALESGKADCALTPETEAKALATQQNGYQYCSNPLYANSASFVVDKGNTALLASINEVIGTFSEDGTLEAVCKKWLDERDYNMDGVPQCDSDKVLRVAISTGNEPLCFTQNERPIGLECELVERIAYALGMSVEYTDMSFAACLPAVASGKADLACGLTYTEERAESVSFTDPYYYENITFLRKNESAVDTTSVWDKLRDNFESTFLTENRWKLFVKGIGVTVLISVCSYLLSTLLGLLLCRMLSSKSALCRRTASVYSTIVTGIPILVWLMILYYMVFRSVDIPGILVAILGFGLEGGAALSGIFKTGLDSVEKGQIEAASALGFQRPEIFRRIIFPQAASRVFSLYMGDFVSLVKSTSIVGYIAIVDLTKVSDVVRSRTYQPFFPLITTALIYFAITALFIALLRILQKKLDPKKRKHILKGVKTR